MSSGFGQPPPSGGGGGFGPPPGGGGGGGFGQPPPSGGGGGFGQPPPSGGGGGFGQPPSSGGAGGGGGAPPGGGGGEGPLAHIPFSADDQASLRGMGQFARFAAIGAIVAGLMTLVMEIAQTLIQHATGPDLIGNVCGGAIGLGINALLAYFLFQAAAAVQRVVDTDDADQVNLVKSFEALRTYFMIKVILYLIVVLLVCCIAVAAVMFGAAIAGAMQST